MPVTGIVEADIPSIFINQALYDPDLTWPWHVDILNQTIEASAALRLEHEDRFWSIVNVDDNADFPHIIWDCLTNESVPIIFSLPREHQTKETQLCHVYSRRAFPSGEASTWPLRDAYNNIRKALAGVPETPIKVDGDIVGVVSQCRRIRAWKRFYKVAPQALTVVEYGHTFQVVFS